MDRIRIRETVVVEGRDDESAVLRAVDAGVLCTHGWGLPEASLEAIRAAYEKQGIIILTDPDHAGQKIRERLTALFPEAKQAWIVRDDAQKMRGGKPVDIGVENASPEAIRDALLAAKASAVSTGQTPFEGAVTAADLIALGLSGTPQSTALRQALGRELGIGSCNAKTFLKRLNVYGISREELLAAWRRISQENR